MSYLEIEPLILDFLQSCEVEFNLSQGTIKMYDYYLRQFLSFLKAKEKVEKPDLSLLSDDLIRSYRLFLNRKLSQRSRSAIKRSTQMNFLISLRAFLRYLMLGRELEVLSPEKIKLGKGQDRQIKVLNEEQIERLIKEPDLQSVAGIRDRAILELLFSTGMRVSELSHLNLSDINLKSGEISVLGKGRKIRVVFVSETAVWALKSYLARRSTEIKPLFIRFRGPKPKDGHESLRLTTRSIESLVKKYAQKAGLAIEPTPHTLRHTFATDLLRNGADLRSVQELLGHKNVSTTQIYTHVTNPQLKEIHKRYHSGNKVQ